MKPERPSAPAHINQAPQTTNNSQLFSVSLFLISALLLNACAHNPPTQPKASNREKTQSRITFRAIDAADTNGLSYKVIPAASQPKLKWTVEVKPQRGGGGGLGWKTTIYVAGFFVLKVSGPPRNVLCTSKIGVPMRNRQGHVSNAYAETAVLTAGQTVGLQMQEELRAKDPEEVLPESSICIPFRQRLERELGKLINGARVTRVPGFP